MNTRTTKAIQIIAMAGALAMAGCYSASNWSPTVDPYADPASDRISSDMYECKQLALQATSTPRETLVGGAVGGLIGAASGAAIGAAAGNPGMGAAVGAGAGGMGGGLYKGLSSESEYKQVFRDCLEGRGHRVLG